MKLLISLLLLTADPAFASNFKFRRDTTPNISLGTGNNWNEIQVFTTDIADSRGLFYVEYDVRNNRLGRANFPKVTVTRACEFRRRSGGSIGDYKPKAVQVALRIVYPGGNTVFFRHNDRGADYNVNPLVQDYKFDRILPGSITAEGLSMFATYCARPGSDRHLVRFSFYTQGSCRWKPENWHKPDTFPFEFGPEVVEGRFQVSLICKR